MKINTIGIIGGTGKMGQYFKSFFEKNGFKVLVSGRKTKLSTPELIQKSDLIILSVFIDKTVEIIQANAQYFRKNHFLFDLTSIKKPVLEAMLKTSVQEVVGGHPMFGPSTSMAGQIVVLSPGRGSFLLEFLTSLFQKNGAKVKVLDAKKHDKMMSIVQGLTHFTDIALAQSLLKTGIKIDEFLNFQSPAYKLKIMMMGRILAQSSRLYGDIQIENSQNIQSTEIFLKAAQQLFDIVKNKDISKFEEYFEESAEYLGEFKDTAMQESDMIIEKIFQNSNKENFPKKEKADIAILGPKNTYSDYACTKRFGEKSDRKYCRTIKDVFVSVSQNKCQYGLVPVENSLAGTVHETYDAFWGVDDIKILEEMDLKIENVLVSKNKTKIKNIEIVYSHSSALGQCSDFFEIYNHIKQVPVSSTTEAIQQLNYNSAAIIAAKTAKKEGLYLLSENIANSEINHTRFYVISKKTFSLKNKKFIRTVLAFRLIQTQAGSLLKILEYFYAEKINILKIESKLVGGKGDTIFFLETEGKISSEQIMNLEQRVDVLKIFGTTNKSKLL